MTSEKKTIFTPFIYTVSCDVTIMKASNCDISSCLEHDREMVMTTLCDFESQF